MGARGRTRFVGEYGGQRDVADVGHAQWGARWHLRVSLDTSAELAPSCTIVTETAHPPLKQCPT